MADTAAEIKWRKLLQDLEPNVPATRELYVKPDTSPADKIVRILLAAPGSFPKFLLVGARGGGKSTELRAVSRKLESKARVVEIDLDKSGVNASSVSAFDILYVCGVALLRHVSDEKEAGVLYRELALRYAGDDPKNSEKLGDLKTALAGIADFSGAAARLATAATALGPAAAPVAAAAIGAGVVSIGLRLLVGQSPVIAETSPSGRALQETCTKIARRARAGDKLPLCVMIDGLEKINGEAGERFRQVFEQTRLLADAEWAAVIAAPPCTLTQTSCVDGRGFTTLPVWGFGPDELDKIRVLIERRFEDCDLNPKALIAESDLDRLSKMSGGLPRHAVQIAFEAVISALADDANAISKDHVSAGIRALGQSLGRGINTSHLGMLRRVAEQGTLPGDEGAATLFADGRILAYPPAGDSTLPRFAVHPLILPDVQRSSPKES